MKNKKVIYTYGVYDLFHSGHLELIRRAKAFGDYLIVGIVKDEAVKNLKGKNRPIIPLIDRLPLISNCKFVNEVIIQDNFNPITDIENIINSGLKINTLVLGEDQQHLSYDEITYLIRTYTMMIERLPRTEGISTSDIIKKIRSEKC